MSFGFKVEGSIGVWHFGVTGTLTVERPNVAPRHCPKHGEMTVDGWESGDEDEDEDNNDGEG